MKKIIEHYGKAKQLTKTCEEASEMIQAICKYQLDPSDLTLYNVKQELGDVYIMMEQVAIILNIKKSEIEVCPECRSIDTLVDTTDVDIEIDE